MNLPADLQERGLIDAQDVIQTTLCYVLSILPADGGKQAGELVGPKAVELPVSIDFLGQPFSEPVLIRIAAAYERATCHRRRP